MARPYVAPRMATALPFCDWSLGGQDMSDSDPSRPTDDKSDEHRDLDDLDARIRKAESEREAEQSRRKSGSAPPADAIGKALRIGVELVVAVLVGTGIGYFLDGLFGTRPWLMVVFFFFGVAAGFLNVIRDAGLNGNTGGSSSETDRQE